MNAKRALRLRRDVLVELTDELLASVAGGEATATIDETWCVLCITYFSCLDTCTVEHTRRCTER